MYIPVWRFTGASYSRGFAPGYKYFTPIGVNWYGELIYGHINIVTTIFSLTTDHYPLVTAHSPLLSTSPSVAPDHNHAHPRDYS